MTPKSMLLAAAAVAAVASAPVTASALTFEGSTYTVETIGAGSGTFSGNTVFEFPITSAQTALNFGITAASGTIFLAGKELGTVDKGGLAKLADAVTAANGASGYYQSDLSGVGSWKVFIKFGSPTGVGSGTYDLGTLPPVPEPATWALMLVGVAGVGGALRRRNRLAVA